jgi:hypothetical protein
MNNKKTEWPISPTFLSLRRGCSEESANYNSDGIYYTDYLRGFLADLSHDKNVQNALSLFQFVPEDFLPHDPNAGDDNHLLLNSKNATVLWNLKGNMKPELQGNNRQKLKNVRLRFTELF